MNHKLPDVQAGFRKGRGTRDQIANICCIIKKPRQFQKNFFDYAKAFDSGDYNKPWKILKEMGMPDHLSHVGQEAAVKTRHGTTDSFQIGKGISQGLILVLCLFNICAEYIMWNAGLNEAQAGIRVARRSINNLRYADDITLVAESEKEWKSLLLNVKAESEKDGLKLSIQKTKIMDLVPSLHATRWETMTDCIFGGSKITADGDCSH